MRALFLAFALFALGAAGLPPQRYELAARFIRALTQNDLKLASTMITPGATIREWSEGPKPLTAVAVYIQRCPIKSLEGNKDRNINLILDCADGYHSASFDFEGNKISEIHFGPPPAIHVTVARDKPND